MKKILGINFGGLKEKTVRMVLSILLITIALFAAVSIYQSRMLTIIVGEAREEQQEKITSISEANMHVMLEGAMAKATSLQAEMADNEFVEVINYIYMMQTMAEGLFANKDKLQPAEVSLPDPALDGTPNVHVLYAEGVDYTKSEYLGIVAHMGDPMLAMLRNSPKLGACYVGLCDGTHFVADVNTANRFDEDGNQIPFPVTERPWYKGAVEADGLYFTGIEPDAFSGEVGITCSIPVHADGKIVGVVGADVTLETMGSFVEISEDEKDAIFIVNDHGQVVLATDDNGVFSVETVDEAQDLRKIGNQGVADFLEKAYQGTTELTVCEIDGKSYYMEGAPIHTLGWCLFRVLDKELTEQPAQQLLAELDNINFGASDVFNEGRSKTGRSIILMIIAILALGIAGGLFVSGRIVKPVEQMTRSITESSRTGKLFEMQECYRTGDEIQVLAESFDDLSKKTKRYIEDITRITQEKERISTELELARKIQADMLPYIYPAFPDRSEFDIYGIMNPAKEVGGDFYDYFLIDDDHLGMVIADVSGKGVPAALFMMMSKILISNFAMMGGSPAEVLAHTNHTICQNNEEEMFVTAWLGILEISTGKIIAANAGHEYPIIRHGNGEFEILKDKHGFVLGGLEGMKYTDYEITLEKGSAIFLYTDGATEATNAHNELFGEKRLLRAVNDSHAVDPVELLGSVKNAISEFVGEADQFDDLTMLGIIYGSENKKKQK